MVVFFQPVSVFTDLALTSSVTDDLTEDQGTVQPPPKQRPRLSQPPATSMLRSSRDRTLKPSQALNSLDSEENYGLFERFAAAAHSDKWFPIVEVRSPEGRALFTKITTLLASFSKDWQRDIMPALHEAFPEYTALNLEEILFTEVLRSGQVDADHEFSLSKLGCLELFSGKRELSKAFVRTGKLALGLDVAYHAGQAIHTATGIRLVTTCLRFLRGLLWMGIECKTWVWINRATYGRSASHVVGNEHSNQAVREANVVAQIATFYCVLATLNGCGYIIENPKSSLINYVPVVKTLFEVTGAKTVMTAHGAFGGTTKKEFKLMGNVKWLSSLKRTCTPAQCKNFELLTKTVDGKVYGKKRQMSNSEHYSVEFAEAVVALAIGE